MIDRDVTNRPRAVWVQVADPRRGTRLEMRWEAPASRQEPAAPEGDPRAA